MVAFRGIPYAASPVGERRFAAPEQHPRWQDPRDATRPGPSVPQGPSRLEAVMGRRVPDWDEDGCLTLNVWTPRLPGAGSAPGALPVLVWFHGGGFTSGSGGWDWYDGRNLAAAGPIVVVTANYRLGPLGYLYLPDLGIENLGTQDQAAVLAWVQRNISAFGGDPGKDIVLVHGGFVDGSGWQGVYDHLTADGYRVAVLQNPTLSLAGDVAATHQVLDGLDGPAVLVGHSYGGAVITEAGQHDQVAALAYITAFAPDKGESVNTLVAGSRPADRSRRSCRP